MIDNKEEIQDVEEVKIQRPKRIKLTAEEVLGRMEALPEREEQIIAAVRKSRYEQTFAPRDIA